MPKKKRKLSRKKIFCVYACIDSRPDELQKPDNRGRVFPKRYIGYTRDFKERKRQHCKDMQGGCTVPFHNYLRAVPKKYHNWSIITDGLTEQQAKDKEKALIKFYDTNVCRGGKGGYNATDGGDGTSGHKWTEEQRKAMSGENNHMYGKRGKDSHWFGRTHTKEAKEKMIKAHSGENNPQWNKHHTKESLEKMSKAKKGKKPTPEHRENVTRGHRKRRLGYLKKNPMQCIRKRYNKFQVKIQGKYQGTFKTIPEAMAFRDECYKRLFGMELWNEVFG